MSNGELDDGGVGGVSRLESAEFGVSSSGEESADDGEETKDEEVDAVDVVDAFERRCACAWFEGCSAHRTHSQHVAHPPRHAGNE